MRPGLDLAGGTGLVIVLSCTTAVNPGFLSAGAGLGDRDLPGAGVGASDSRSARCWPASRPTCS